MGGKKTAEQFLSFTSFFWILLQETVFSPSKSTETSNQVWHTGTDPRVCVCVTLVCFVVNCQRFRAKEEKRSWRKTTLASYTRPSGHRSEGFWLELSALFGFFELHHTHAHNTTQYRCGVGQACSSGSTPTQWTLQCMQMPWLEREVKHFFFLSNCVVLCISPGLITVLCRAWVGGWGCAPEAVAERTDEKVEGLISLGIALPFVVEWPLIALTTPLRLITAGLHISHCFCRRWWLVWVHRPPITLPSLEYISDRLSLLFFFLFFFHITHLL